MFTTIFRGFWPLLLLFTVAACGDPPLFDLSLVTPPGADPLASVDTVKLTVSNPPASVTQKVVNPASFSIELDVEVESLVGTITLEGLSGSALVARGETPPLILRPEAQQMNLMVSPAGRSTPLSPTLQHPGLGMLALLLPGSGVLFVGGQQDVAAAPRKSAQLYDFFEHKLRTFAELPAARAFAVGAYCGDACAVVALGRGEGGLADKLLRHDGSGWQQFDDGLDAATRRERAGIAPLGDGTYLVVGGQDAAGKPLDTLLRLAPSTAAARPTLTVLSPRSVTARLAPAASPGKGAVVIVGGQAAGAPACEIFYTSSFQSQAHTLAGTPPASGAAAVDLADGRVVIVGGQDASGNPLADAWIVEPETLKSTRVENALIRARSGHKVVRLGGRLFVWGGTCAGGTLCSEGEILDAKTAKSAATFALGTPRSGFVLERLGRGSFLVGGGQDASGPAGGLELVQTDEALQ